MKFYQMLFKTAADARRACIGILGGGGKTSLLHLLGKELAQTHKPVVLSSLTKDGISQDQKIHFYPEWEDEERRAVLIRSGNPIYIMDSIEDDIKLLGLTAPQLEILYEASELTIFECDGARKRPIKAHQSHDPVIPDFASHAIIVVGADAVGARVESKFVHRPELFRELWDVSANYELEPQFIAKILTSQYGYLQKVPDGTELAYLVNKSDVYPEQAQLLAKALARVTKAPVYAGSIEAKILERIR